LVENHELTVDTASVAGLRLGRARLTGIFGVFYPGTLALSFKGRGGDEVKAVPIGRVTPDEILKVDLSVEVPAGTRRLSWNFAIRKGSIVGNWGTSR
jgi:hypothetical protein